MNENEFDPTVSEQLTKRKVELEGQIEEFKVKHPTMNPEFLPEEDHRAWSQLQTELEKVNKSLGLIK